MKKPAMVKAESDLPSRDDMAFTFAVTMIKRGITQDYALMAKDAYLLADEMEKAR